MLERLAVAPNFRIEPEIGFFRSSSEIEQNGDNGSYDSKSTLKSFHVGVGIFPMVSQEKSKLYYGARLGIIRNSSSRESSYSYEGYSDSDEDSNKASGFYVAPTIGGEYFLSNHFSLGGEAQLRYSTFSEEGDDNNNAELSASSTATKALIFIRFYF